MNAVGGLRGLSALHRRAHIDAAFARERPNFPRGESGTRKERRVIELPGRAEHRRKALELVGGKFARTENARLDRAWTAALEEAEA